MKASLMISTPQRLFISVLENRDYPTAFMIRIRKSVQNIIRRLKKSAVGNGQKCNCVMIRLMFLPWHSRTDRWNSENWLSVYWQTTYALSCQTKTKVIRADGKRAGFGNAFRAVEVLKLNIPKPHNSLEETQQWLTEGGVISAVKSFYFLEEHDALGGLEKVGTMLDKARYSNSLSSKLTAHLQRINRTDLIPISSMTRNMGKGVSDE